MNINDPIEAADPLDVSRAELYRDDTWHEPTPGRSPDLQG